MGKTELKTVCRPGIFPLVGQQIHLQKLLVRLLLNLDQIRNRNGSLDFGEINSLGGGAVLFAYPCSKYSSGPNSQSKHCQGPGKSGS